MNRQKNIEALSHENYDICIIGAGASGAGCALDAAKRGFKVALIERNDFASETSSKATKLIHGGVRYLEQAFKNFDFAQLEMVQHGLQERHILLQNAPHLAHPLPLITPVFSWIEGLYFSIGLRIYGLFAKNDSLPKAEWLSKKESLERISGLTPRINSSVMYYDGQFDDARFCLALAHTAHQLGATVVNHVSVKDFKKTEKGTLETAILKDEISKKTIEIKAKLFINCTGVHADKIRKMANKTLESRIRPSKGVHIMLPMSVLPTTHAMLIPKTKDGRVVFVIPFEGKIMIGTTDDDYKNIEEEPLLEAKEVDFLLETLKPYVARCPEKHEIEAGFGGLRPLIAASSSRSTKKLVRDHEVEHDKTSNLVSLLGGKWTTYRLMAKDTLDKACQILRQSQTCTTEHQLLVGAEGYDFEAWRKLQKNTSLSDESCQHILKKYGSNYVKIENIIAENSFLSQKIAANYPYIKAEIVYAIEEEMAMTLRDFFARRTRLELLDWKTTQQSIEEVAQIMGEKLAWSSAYQEQEIAEYEAFLKKMQQKVFVS